MRRLTILPLLLALLAGPVAALDLRGPRLAAASNFGQGMSPDMMAAALALPVRDFRDAVYWAAVEDPPGRFRFDTPRTSFPDLMAAGDARMSLTVNNGHPAFDEGATPHTAEAVRAFGAAAAATVARFPAIDAVEVGNEFNSANFVSGPVSEGGLDARAKGYVALLRSVATQVRAVRPDVRIIGGGVHSIPTGYLSRLTALGAADSMDAVALHPYSTPIDHLARQIAVMRRDPALAGMPVEITEFGSQDPEAAPGVLIRAYCQMALSGVSRAVWYALNRRGDGYAPLIGRDLKPTAAGRAYLLAQEEFAGRPVRDMAPDPFTYACLFEDRALVIWGMPRHLRVSEAVTVRDATGAPLPGREFTLSETQPLILTGTGALEEGRDYTLAPQRVVADSFHQFPYPAEGRDTSDAPGFRRYVVTPRGRSGLQTMPGQARDASPWTPYLGLPDDRSVLILPETALPGGGAGYPVRILHEFVAPEAMTVDLEARFVPAERSADGITVSLGLNGEEMAVWQGREPITIERSGIALKAGDGLSLSLGPGASAQGDVTGFRITLRRAD